MIKNYFKEYTKIYWEMKKALKRYIEAKIDFYNLSGIKYDDMPKSRGKYTGLDDLLARIEELNKKYTILEKKYYIEKEKCQRDIDKLEDPIYKTIIEYSYLEFEDDKTLLASLEQYHHVQYSYSYLRKLKSNAIEEFEKIIKENKKEQNRTI